MGCGPDAAKLKRRAARRVAVTYLFRTGLGTKLNQNMLRNTYKSIREQLQKQNDRKTRQLIDVFLP